MDLLELLAQEYQLSNVRRCEQADVFFSDQGLKRVRFWNDKFLLNWHVQWREDTSQESDIMTDRMIRTNNGQTEVRFKDGWLTLHDEVTTLYPMQGYEKVWGAFISILLKNGLVQPQQEIPYVRPGRLSLEQTLELVKTSKYLPKRSISILEKCCFEAEKREKMATNVQQQASDQPMPLLDSVSSLSQAKQIFDVFVWQGSNQHPQLGYLGIRTMFEQWLAENGEGSTLQLVDEVDANFSIDRSNGRQLLVECLIPWELYDCLEQLQETEESGQAERLFEQFQTRWENSRQLVQLLSQWMDQRKRGSE